jgi:hypothetical protein
MPAFCSVVLAVLVKRQVFEISPGQVPSLRAEPQISNTRDGVAFFDHAVCAASICFFVVSHSTDKS